jgi:hypothetical protein
MITKVFTIASLHTVLVVIYLTLSVVHFQKLEEHVVLPLGSSSVNLQHLLTGLSQVTVVLFSISLLLVTRKLAFRDYLYHESLTWPGAGALSIGANLFQRLRLWYGRAPGFGMLVTYLGCLSILLATAPTLFELVPFDQVNVFNVTTMRREMHDYFPGDKIGFLDFDYDAKRLEWEGSYSDSGPERLGSNIVYGFVWDGIPSIPHSSSDLSLGPPIVGNIAVNATTFDVRCGKLSSATSKSIGNNTWLISTPISDITLGLPILEHNVVRVAPVPWSESVDGLATPYSVLLYSTIPIEDPYGQLGSSVELEFITDAGEIQSRKITVAGCTLYVKHVTAYIDHSNELVSVQDDNSTHTTEDIRWKWQEWASPDYSPNVYTTNWGGVWNVSYPAPKGQYIPYCSEEIGRPQDLNIVEWKLNQLLYSFCDEPLMYLGAVEQGLTHITTYIFRSEMWSGEVVPGNITVTQVMSKLQLNTVPLAISFFLSVTLSVLAILLLSSLFSWHVIHDTFNSDRIMIIPEPYPRDIKDAALFDVQTVRDDGDAGNKSSLVG